MVAMAKTDMEEADRESDALSPVQDERTGDTAKVTGDGEVDIAGATTTDERAEVVHTNSDGSAEECAGINMFDDEQFDADDLSLLFDAVEDAGNLFLNDEQFDQDDLPSLFDATNSGKFASKFYDERFDEDDLPNLFDCSNTSKYANAANAYRTGSTGDCSTNSSENESRNTKHSDVTESDSDSDLDLLHLFSDNEDEDDSKRVKTNTRSTTTQKTPSSTLVKSKPTLVKSKPKVDRKHTTYDHHDYYDAEVISRINSVVYRCASTHNTDCTDCDMGTIGATQTRAATSTRAEEDTCCICLDSHTDPTTLPKCSHKFCKECIEAQFRIKPVCPVCFTSYGIITGIQPKGTMNHYVDQGVRLPGHESHGTIVISYTFPNGTQTAEHPHPGVTYTGTSRVAYLPDSPEGRKVLRLLEESFRRRLTFTVGRSRTTGADNTVTWNDIHHKTATCGGMPSFGYPDPTYLSRVQEELAALGVTEESLNAYSNHTNFA